MVGVVSNANRRGRNGGPSTAVIVDSRKARSHREFGALRSAWLPNDRHTASLHTVLRWEQSEAAGRRHPRSSSPSPAPSPLSQAQLPDEEALLTLLRRRVGPHASRERLVYHLRTARGRVHWACA